MYLTIDVQRQNCVKQLLCFILRYVFVSTGSLQLTGTADQIMEHVASYLGKDPVTVKQLNLYKKGQLDFGGIPISSNNLEVIFKSTLRVGFLFREASDKF